MSLDLVAIDELPRRLRIIYGTHPIIVEAADAIEALVKRVRHLEASEGPTMVDAGHYETPAHGWTCFHCGETFKTARSAREHFGASPDAEPSCMLKVQAGGERGLLRRLRAAEAELARYRAEDSNKDRAMAAMASDHGEALRREEEKGYERGVRDMLCSNCPPTDYSTDGTRCAKCPRRATAGAAHQVRADAA